MKKQCTKCKIEKPLSEFYKNKKMNLGVRSWCKDCHKESNKKWRLNNPEKVKEIKKNYRLNNPDYYKNWKLNNPDYKKNYKKNYDKERKKTDPLFKLSCKIREMIHRVLKLSGEKKNDCSIKLIGFTQKQLKDHLENKFKPEMNWENHGTYWEIDHIVPVSWFIENSIKNPKIINSLTNLQPLTVEENGQKGDKCINQYFNLNI